VFVEDPTALGFPGFHDRYWNPLFAVLEEAGAPLVMHMQSVPVRMVQGPETPFAVDLTLMYCTSMATMVNLLFSPVFLDFPALKVVLPEGGLGWVPFMLEKADFLWERHGSYARGVLASNVAPPSELYLGRIFSTIQSHDDAGIALRDRLGIDQILWQCDYPHADSTWPETRGLMGGQLAGVSPDDRAAIMGVNALRVFQLD
jgi:predicted TIM-barrel fold metal-dependent hydrolase